MTTPRTSLRLWPGPSAAAVLVVAAVLAVVVPATFLIAMIVALASSVVILIWWLFFSRAPWLERLGALVVMAAAALTIHPLLHRSIAGAGQEILFWVLSVPVMLVGLVLGAAVSRERGIGMRRVTMVVAIFVACAFWTIVRTPGVSGEGGFVFDWRWTPTAEERLLAQAESQPTPLPAPAVTRQPPTPPATATVEKPATAAPTATVAAVPAAPAPAAAPAWPGFRGPNRDAVVRGVRLETDWARSPPRELWQRAIGPGWSSFAVQGDLLFTQEQRGEEEIVACYRVSTGAPVWRHKDAARFYESNGGAGPRATPTIHNGRVYAFGATGILNVLEAASGALVWTRNLATDMKMEVPYWGFTSSPLVIDDLVIVAASSKLAAYELASGKLRWSGPARGGSFSSPHRATIDGVEQVLLLSGNGATSVAPATGDVLWEHEWKEGTVVVQPALMPDGDVLINAASAMGGAGLRRLHAARGGTGWTVEERWTSTGLKPYFNDFVIHNGHAYGFDGNIMSSINLTDGKRNWKGGRYGAGQVVLLADQDLLLVIAEEGDFALVAASPDKFTEIARVPGIEGKTWNHPAIVGDLLLVRNGEEMAAFRLPTKKP
jgi:outer membrane protein assembly factor BamB